MPSRKRSNSATPALRERSRSAAGSRKKNTEKEKESKEKTGDNNFKYLEVFNAIDKNKDGKIDLLELNNYLGDSYTFTPYRIQLLMNEADLDRDGTIDFVEFCRVMESHKNLHDHWGDASRSIWRTFQSRTNQFHEITESLCKPFRELINLHSARRKEVDGHKIPNPILRIIALFVEPLVIFCFLLLVAFTLDLLLDHTNLVNLKYDDEEMKSLRILVFISIFVCLPPIQRGQTYSQYVFGLRYCVMNRKKLEYCGVYTIVFFAALQGLFTFAVGVYLAPYLGPPSLFKILALWVVPCLIEGVFLYFHGEKTLSDAIMGVRVVVLET